MIKMKHKVQECELFYLFIRAQGTNQITELMGPMTEDSIERIKHEYFENDPELQILNEQTFKIVYQTDYENNFNDNWTDQLFHHLNSKFIDLDLQIATYAIDDENVEEMDPEKEYQDHVEFEDILLIGRVGLFKYNYSESKIVLYANIDADATLTAQLSLEIYKYCEGIVQFEVANHYYEKADGEFYNGDQAIEKFYDDKLFETNLN